ncbi:MAG: serine hydrolase [Gammaproteobacteria bacterium]|jgi:CubicO group peptidase (beta-lactamase class C family)|nr:serine hydrolase [Gammaproteobacteria bacterium]
MRTIKLYLGFLILTQCVLLNAAEEFVPANSLEELEQRINLILEETETPGMIATIVYGDETIWRGALGFANKIIERPVTVDTQFRVGSISKSITSLAILKLVESGQLNLDDLISEVAPRAGVENAWQETDPVRLVHVLEHTAGFDDIHFRDFEFSDPNVTTLEGIEFNNNSREVRWRPGTRMAYSNIGPAIAALALENVTGMSFENFVNREIFAPLGMNTASFFHVEGVSSSFNLDGSASPYIHIPVRSSGSLNATSSDMAQLLKMYIGRGTLDGVALIQPQSLTRMETSSSTLASTAGLQVGYGLSNYTTQKNGFVFHGHDGGIDAFISRYAYLPEFQRGYFYSVNQGNLAAFNRIDEEIVGFITRDLTAPEAVTTIEQTEDDLISLTGFYEADSPRMEILAGIGRLGFSRVQYVDGGLQVNPLFGAATDLLPVGNNQFKREAEVLASYAFVTSPDNEELMQADSGTFKKISPVIAYGRLVALVYAIIILASSLLFTLVWGFQKIRGQRKQAIHALVRIIPIIGSVVFALLVFLAMNLQGLDSLSSVSIWTGGYWLVSLIYPVLAVLSLYVVLSHFPRRHEIGIWVWHHALHTTVGLLILMLFLASWGFVGLQTWAY